MSSFLQSEEWELFQKSLGRKTWRLRGALCILHELPFGFRYLYSPHPDLKEDEMTQFLDAVLPIAKKEHALFLKIDPLNQYSVSIIPYTIRVSESLQPHESLLLDLKKSLKEILSDMHQKTRYNIRVAEKNNLSVRICETKEDNEKYLDIFWELLSDTAKRDGFHTHEKIYYEKLLSIRSDNFQNILFLVFYNDIIIAGAVVNFYGERATYLHGASSYQHRSKMAPHVLHWGVIQEAKKRNMKIYDLWGIDPVRWLGLTRFKQGFGGKEIVYPESFGIIYRPFWYTIYRIRAGFKGFF